MASAAYNRGKSIVSKSQWEAGNLRCMLVKTGFSFDNNHDFVSDISANEATVSGYARQTPANATATVDDTNDRVDFTFDDVAYGALAAGETILGMVVFDNVGGADSARQLIAFIDVPDTPTNGGTITIDVTSPVYRRT